MRPAPVAVAEVALSSEPGTQLLQCLRELSHDMRTPVACILALGQQVLGGQSADHQAVERMMGHARHLMRMMDGFIAQSRVDAGTSFYKSERLLQDLLDESIEQVRDLAAQRGIRLACGVDGPCYFVQVAGDLMVRALTNLLVNAIKYGEPGSVIEVSCRTLAGPEREAVVVEVSNQVATLPQDGAPLTKSCGLGLDFVRKVVARHDGRLDLDLGTAGRAYARITLPCDIERL